MFRTKRWLLLISLLVILLLLSACSWTQQESLTPTMVNSTSPTPQILLATTNTIKPSQVAPTQTLTPTLQATANCPTPNSQAKMFEAETGSEAEYVILDYLNQGGSPEQLQMEMDKLGAILDSFQVTTVDINADGIKEIVIVMNFVLPKGGSLEEAYGNLSIYNCSEGAYRVTKIAGENQEKIEVLAIENLQGSENPEILVSEKWLFFSGCEEFVEMYSLAKQGWVSSFKTDESPCEIQTELKNGNNGYKILVIEGSRVLISPVGPREEKNGLTNFRAMKLN